MGTTRKENYLGVTLNVSLKVFEQCGSAALKVNRILELIRRNTTDKEVEIIKPIYKSVVKPHLECCIQASQSYRTKDITILERIKEAIIR